MVLVRSTRARRFLHVLAAAAGLAVCVIAGAERPSAAQDPRERSAREPEIPSALQQAQCLGGDAAPIVHDAVTGALRFVGTDPGRPIPRLTTLDGSASPETAARAYLAACGSLLGVSDHSTQLATVTRPSPRGDVSGRDQSVNVAKQQLETGGRSSVRFQQFHQGIPVLGGEIIVNLDRDLNVLSVNGETLADASALRNPAIDAATAAQTALVVASRAHGVGTRALTTSAPALWLYSPGLIGPDQGATVLVWRVEVTPRELLPIRELVLVDAATGAVPLHFNQIHTAMQRQTYTANNGTTLPGTLVCDESNPGCAGGDTHAVAAHTAAKDTYDYYFGNHGRDSINNAGLAIRQTVHYGLGYANAFWNGAQMVYGDGYGFALADDVVGHELTHGVTQYESNLFYYYQSGAINESFSDVWGEFVDQTNGRGNDSAGVKWLMGEDISGIGAIRDMKNPPAFSDPDRMTSVFYHTSGSDSGGVHSNSGINNKAVSLMVDGGVFNGQTIGALGITKVARIYYEVQTNLLTSGSDYADLYNALFQACTNLVGTAGITTSDCGEVRKATQAVEMHLQPVAEFNPDAPVCGAGQTAANVFFDNFESGSGNFASGAIVGPNRWQFSPSGRYATSGINFFRGVDAPAVVTDSWLAMTSSVTLPANAYLHFAQAFGFEEGNYDGGVLEYSTDSGASWSDAGALFDFNGYRGTIVTISTGRNPLAGRQAFVGDSHGYISSRLNLSGLAGRAVRFRWRMGLDYIIARGGWWLDDVRVYTCGAPPAAPEPIAPNETIATLTPTYTWYRVPDATWYRITIQTPPGSALFSSWYEAAAVCPVGSTTCSLNPGATPSPPALSNGASYVWKAQTWSPGGYGGEGSRVFSVSVGAPGPPTPMTPAGSVVTSTPTYTWNREAGATSTWYLLEISTNPAAGVSTSVFSKWYEAPAICSVTTCTVQPSTPLAPPALPNGPHKWNVRGWLGVNGSQSSSLAFTTSSPTAAPQAARLLSPASLIGGTAPSYTWEKAPTATTYTLWLNELPGFLGAGGNLLNRVYDAAAICGATTCSVGAATALPPPLLDAGKSYRWWVRAQSAVGAGPWSSSLDFRVGYPVTGRVSVYASPTNLANVKVRFYSSSGSLVAEAVTDASGLYTAGLLPGDYFVRTSNAQGLIDEIYPAIPCGPTCNVITGSAITVTSSGVSGINFALGFGAHIEGTVTNAVTTPLANVTIDFYNANREYITSALTNASGQFLSDAGLPNGSYFARTSNDQSYVDKLYADIDCLANCDVTAGTPIAVTVGETTGGVDFVLDPGGLIAGRVTTAATGAGITGGRVDIYMASGSSFIRVAEGVAGSAGNYVSTPSLPPGTHYARTSGFASHVDELYDNITCFNCTAAGGAPITVTAGVTTVNINFVLTIGGSLTGLVTQSSGGALAGIDVSVYNTAGSLVGSATSSNAGTYGPLTLPPGTYYARTSNTLGFANKLFNDITCDSCPVTTGTPINVAEGVTTGGINFALSSSAFVAGRVTDANTTAALADVTVQLYTANGTLVTTGTTDAAGNYTTTSRVPSGVYYARTFNAPGYGNILYNNYQCFDACVVTSGTPIVVTGPATRTNVNFALTMLPVAPTLISPVGTISAASPAFVWNTVSQATWYQVSVADGVGWSHATGFMSASICSAGTCSTTLPITLGAKAYTWRVQGFNYAGYGPWSAPTAFTVVFTLPPAVTLLGPSGVTPTNTPTYQWNREPAATWYSLVVSMGGAPIFQRWYVAQPICGATTCSAGPTTPATGGPAPTLAPGTYSWTIQTWNDAGYGGVSAPMSFTISPPGAATLLAPTGTVSVTRPTYSWTAVPGATWYYLWVNEGTGPARRDWYRTQDVCIGAQCSIQPPDLRPGPHTWWIQTWSPVGYGPWSAPMAFTVSAPGLR